VGEKHGLIDPERGKFRELHLAKGQQHGGRDLISQGECRSLYNNAWLFLIRRVGKQPLVGRRRGSDMEYSSGKPRFRRGGEELRSPIKEKKDEKTAIIPSCIEEYRSLKEEGLLLEGKESGPPRI